MAVTRVKELNRERGGEWSASASRRYTRTFRVETDDLDDGPATVLLAAGLPQLFSSYASGNDADTGALLRDVRPRQIGAYLWEVSAEYSTSSFDPSVGTPPQQGGPADALGRAPVVKWSFRRHRVAVERDANGRGVVNSAGDPFDPPPEKDEVWPHLSYQRYEAAFNPALALEYHDATNADVFLGALPGQAQCEGIEAELDPQEGALVWRVSYEFNFRRDGFALKKLDQGFRRRPAGEEPELIRDPKGEALSAPTLLNGAGRALSGSSDLLVGAANAAQNTITVQGPYLFPEPPFDVLLDAEVMHVTARAGLVLTVVRGYAGTAAAAHANATVVYQEPYYREFTIFPSLPFVLFGL